jgi:3-dehydroquinate dehydratase/shikimate dehydrogenase
MRADVFFNATALGMWPDTERSVFDDAMPELDAHTLVFDAVYNPPVTKLLRQARDRGALTAGGVEMFVAQAAAQFEAWTASPAPLDLFRDVMRKKLGDDS